MDRLVHIQSDRCKYCNSTNIVKYGTFQGMQRYFCKSCHRKFADNDALPKMKTPTWIISLALNCYYDGMSLGAIQREINQQHGAIYAQSSIYNWIIRFSEEAVRQAKSFQPKVGNKWFLRIAPTGTGNHRLWFTDIFDMNSKFLLSSSLSETKEEQEVIGLIMSTLLTAQKTLNLPITIILSDALDFDKFTRRVKESELHDKIIFGKTDRRSIEPFDKLLKKRGYVVHSFKSISKAHTLTEAWRLHYNFLTGDNETGRVPPAQKMGKAPFKKWKDVVSQSLIKIN